MGYDLDDLIGEDGELREPMPPRKKKPRDPNYWRNLLMAVGVEIVLGIVVTFVALLLFGNGDSTPPPPSATPDAAQTRSALLLEITLTAIAEWTDTPTSTVTATPTSTATLDAAQTRAALLLELTQTAIAEWTDTPTATLTPSITHTPTATETEKPTVTFTPSDTPTVTLTATPSYQGITRDSAPHVTARYELTGHTTWVYALAWSPDSAFLASAGEFDGQESIWIWDVASATVFRQFPAHDDRILSLSWSEDLIASSSEDNTVRVWNTSGREVRQFTNFTNAVECVTFSSDGSMLAAASQDGTLAVWNMPGGGEAHRINAGHGSLTCVTWSPDGDLIATIGNSDQVRVYSAATGTEVRTMEGPGFGGAEVIWSPDGRLIATRSETALLQVWNAEGGNQIGVGWQGRDPAWSPEGTMLAGNLSRVVYIWDMDDDPGQFGQVLAQMPGHTGSISAVVWSADGRYIASSGEDRTIRIWGVAP